MANTQDDGEALQPELIAYRLSDRSAMALRAAEASRDWMNATEHRFAYRCLPMLVANQAGWLILNSHTFRAHWDGSDGTSGVTILYLEGEPPFPAVSMFGYGIVTFTIPYLFRTPKGYNLLVRGPANWPKDAVYPLEGLVEADWAVATFTMNWKLTRVDHVVSFDVGEPICMLVPQKRGELESFHPRLADVESAPDVADGHRVWAHSRFYFKAALRTMGARSLGESWQKHYFHGTSPDGHSATAHQTRLSLREFAPERER